MCKTVIVTGATGLIGKETIKHLLDLDFKCIGVSRSSPNIDVSSNLQYQTCDIFDSLAIHELFRAYKPSHLLHLAWSSTGNFNSVTNFEYLAASLNILHAFHLNGGKRAVMAGTYAEYGNYNGKLEENLKPQPFNLYTKSKCYLNQIAADYCKAVGISFSWGRIFSAFGKESDSRRLTKYVIDNLKRGEQVNINSGDLVRDYIYVKDVGRAFAQLLNSEVQGNINICSGKGTSISSYVNLIASLMNKKDLVKFKPVSSTQQTSVIGDSTKLYEELHFTPQFTLEESIKDLINEYNN